MEDWQKELYKKVMLEIHSALEAMGFEILNRDVLICIKKVKDLYIDICETERAISSAASSPRDPGRITGLKQERGANLDTCQKKGAKSTAHYACSPDLLLRIKQDDQMQQSPAHSNAEPILTSVFSLQKDKEELHPKDGTEGCATAAHRRLSQTIKQEKGDNVRMTAGGCDSAGTPTGCVMKYEDLDYMKVSVAGPGSDSNRATSREPIECVHPEAAGSFSPQCQDAAEDSSKDSSEEPSIISPDRRPHPSDVMEERVTAPEAEPPDQHQFSAISSTLHSLTSHQRESNLLMQEQNAILSQIAYSLNLLQIQQTDGLAALGSIIQRGIEVIRPSPCMTPNDRTTEHSSVHSGLRRQVMNNADQPVPPKRKIT